MVAAQEPIVHGQWSMVRLSAVLAGPGGAPGSAQPTSAVLERSDSWPRRLAWGPRDRAAWRCGVAYPVLRLTRPRCSGDVRSRLWSPSTRLPRCSTVWRLLPASSVPRDRTVHSWAMCASGCRPRPRVGMRVARHRAWCGHGFTKAARRSPPFQDPCTNSALAMDHRPSTIDLQSKSSWIRLAVGPRWPWYFDPACCDP